MYLFSAKKEETSITTYLPVLLLVAILAVFTLFSSSMVNTNVAREKEILENAIDRSVTQCYALEGTYPSNLTYLEENYGLLYNKEQFFIDYQYIGGNLRPDITIIERD